MAVSKDAISTALTLFAVKGMKGRPQVETKAQHDFMLNVWQDDLKDIDEIVFIAACKSLSGELTFFPSFAEIRQRCVKMQHGDRPTALEIWPRLKKEMTAVTYAWAGDMALENALNGIKDPIVYQAARCFDWTALANSNADSDSYHRTQFERLYNSIALKYETGVECQRLGLPAPGNISGLISGMVKRIE